MIRPLARRPIFWTAPGLVAIETHTCEQPMRWWLKDQCWIWSDSRPLGVHDLFVRHVHVWIFPLLCLLFTWCNSVVIWGKQLHVTCLWIPMNYIHISRFKHHTVLNPDVCMSWKVHFSSLLLIWPKKKSLLNDGSCNSLLQLQHFRSQQVSPSLFCCANHTVAWQVLSYYLFNNPPLFMGD